MKNDAGEYIEKSLLSLTDILKKAHIGNERYLSDDDIDEAVNKALEQVGKEAKDNPLSDHLIRKDSLEKIINSLKL